MLGERTWKSNICGECGKRVEILNGDVQFSMDLHFQSHKSLDTITQEIDQRMRNVQVGSKNSKKWDYSCPECKENVLILNNDVSFSLQLHAQKHKSGRVESRSEDQSSISSVKSKGSDKKVQDINPKSQVAPISILDGVLDSMPSGLKLHRGFVSENKTGKAFCNICNVTIDPVFSISEHLKTKSHEDKTITFLTNTLPSELHQVMEFVSFYGSNLCCNLCRNQIELCSNNPHETIVNIMAHNSSKGHLGNKTNDESSCNSDGAFGILKSLARINPILNDNKHLIECQMLPQFKCKLCEKSICYDKSEKILYDNFNAHLISKGHLKCSEASSVFEAFNLSHFPGKERHSLTVSKGSIYCTVCNCSVEVNLQQLISHVRQLPTSDAVHNYQPDFDLTPPPGKGTPASMSQTLKRLLSSLPYELRNTNCVVEVDQGQVVCLVCSRGIPATTYNLQTHLLGKSHKSKLEEVIPTDERNYKCGTELTENSLLLKNLFEVLPASLRKDIKFIQSVSKEKVNCSVCKTSVSAHSKCLQEHLEGASHKKLVDKQQLTKLQEKINLQSRNKDVLLEKLMKADAYLKSCAKYLIVNGDHYSCRLCEKNKISKSNDEQTLKNNILSHMNGQKHKTSIGKVYDDLFEKLALSDPIVKTDEQFLQKQQGGMFCTLCSCGIPVATEFNGFKTNLLSHLTGSRHIGNKKSPNEMNAAPSHTPFSVNERIRDPVKMELFKSFPMSFLGDMPFLKNSSIEGYLSCTLCNSVISALYLKEHLEDANHIQKKSLVRQPASTPNTSDDQEVARNMGTLISLLGNIDKKLSWPVNK